ncbi:MAG: hypothetical protein GY928_37535 [Colwellia sp.]|nr:hypothetical protein [Colwellia sp.]
MKPTKEMIEAVERINKSEGKCKEKRGFCDTCPLDADCDESIPNYKIDKNLQTSAKNWLKENGVKSEIF